MANFKKRFCELIKPASMFCSLSDFGVDFTIQAMFETPRSMVILVVRLRAAAIFVEFEEDTFGLARLSGTFDVRRVDEALAYVKRNLDELRAGTRHPDPVDVDMLMRATA